MSTPREKIAVNDICYYLDSQRQDGIDRGQSHWRSHEVFSLKEKLLQLPRGEFELAMRTMLQMVGEIPKHNDQDAVSEKKQASVKLFHETQKALPASFGQDSSSKVSGI